jgi:hypothetical protein
MSSRAARETAIERNVNPPGWDGPFESAKTTLLLNLNENGYCIDCSPICKAELTARRPKASFVHPIAIYGHGAGVEIL